MREGVRLTPGGERAARLGGLTNLTPTLTVQYPNVDALLASSELVSMVENHYLVLNAAWRQAFARYAALQQAWDRGTVAFLVGPLGPGGRIGSRVGSAHRRTHTAGNKPIVAPGLSAAYRSRSVMELASVSNAALVVGDFVALNLAPVFEELQSSMA
jgi:hypothetical protein